MKVKFNCEMCGKYVEKSWCKTMPGKPRFCSWDCKSAFQRTAKPVTKEWLIEHYLEKKMDCTQIAKLVNRNSKRVGEWLRDFGITTSHRGGTTSRGCFKKGQKNLFGGRQHTPETRAKLSAIAKAQGRVPYDPQIGSYMRGRKGADTPNWKGGITADRQAFYASKEWKNASRQVWNRDGFRCQRCNISKILNKHIPFDIHHVVSFQDKDLRSTVSNLVLLCEPCHYWVHSKKNKNNLFICR